MTILYFDVGETLQTRTWIVRNGPLATSTPIDLTNAASVQLLIGSPFPSATKACTFIADATGTVSVQMLAIDLNLAGRYTFKTRITFNDGTITDVPKPGFDEIDVGAVRP